MSCGENARVYLSANRYLEMVFNAGLYPSISVFEMARCGSRGVAADGGGLTS